MTYAANELFAGQDRAGFPRVKASYVSPKTLAAVGGAPTYPILTPMAFNTSTHKWVVWTVGGGNGTGTISGFIYPDAVDIDATNDVLAQIMLRGQIHRDDVPIPTGEIQADLDAALKTGLRALGIDVQGLAGVAS